jgi:hypothetical protein
MFLPEHLMRAVDHATVSANGRTRPLVARTDTVQWISDYDATTAAVDWPFSLSGLFLILVLGWTSWQAAQQRPPTGRGDAFLFAVIGLLGGVMCYLWLVSTYTVTNSNLNLLWAWPTHLLAALALLRWPQMRGLRLYLAGTAGVAVIIALGWPFWPQNFHTAVLPLVLAVGVRAGWWALLSPTRREQQSALTSPMPALRWRSAARGD